LKLKYDNIFKKDKLYMANYNDFVQIIKEIPEQVKSAMIFGHNPGLTFFACTITKENIENIPTAGVVRIDFNINSWQEISSVKGKLIFFEYPKKYSIV
jgi:phosphohistidine phosphatase